MAANGEDDRRTLWGTRVTRRACGLAVVACIAALLPGAGCESSHDSKAEPQADSDSAAPSRLVSGTCELDRDRGLSFSLGKVSDTGDIIFKPPQTGEGFVMSAGAAGTRIMDVGPVGLDEIEQAPADVDQAESQVPLSTGHSYVVSVSGGQCFAKFRVAKTDYRFYDEAPYVRLLYVYQANGTRSFVAQPRSPLPLEALRNKQALLEKRIDEGIPAFRQQLEDQAREVNREIRSTSSESSRTTLRMELRDIARLLAASDEYETQCKQTLVRVRSAVRRLERLDASNKNLGLDHEQSLKDLWTLEQEAGARLDVTLGTKLGAGAIEDRLVDEKLQQLKK